MKTILKESKCFACGWIRCPVNKLMTEGRRYPETEYITGDMQSGTFSASSYNGSSVTFCYCPKCGTMKHEDFLYTKSELIK